MQSSKTPNQIDGIDSDDFPVWETIGNDVQGNSVIAVIESGNQNTVVQNQEIGITGRQTQSVKIDAFWHRQFHYFR